MLRFPVGTVSPEGAQSKFSVGVMTVTKSCSFCLVKKMLSEYCSPAESENLLAKAAKLKLGTEIQIQVRIKTSAGNGLYDIFERFFK